MNQFSIKLLSSAHEDRTLLSVTNARNPTRPASQTSLVGTSEVLGCETSTCGGGIPETLDVPIDIEQLLLDAAELVLVHMRLLRSVVSSRSEAQQIVMEVHRAAEGRGHAPAGAIGVTAFLAELISRVDENAIAETLCRARRSFTDVELLDGSASLLASAESHVGRLFGIEPEVVAHEVGRHMDLLAPPL